MHRIGTRGHLVEAASNTECGWPYHVSSLGVRFNAPVDAIPVYWGPNVSSAEQSTIPGFLNVLQASQWAKAITSEYGSYGFVPQPAVTITLSSDYGSTIDDVQIQDELTWQVENGFIPVPANQDVMFLLFFPPNTTITAEGVSSCQPGGFCAYHSHIAHGVTWAYAVVPDFSSSECSSDCATGVPTTLAAMEVSASHEIAEILSDPVPPYGFAVRNPNLPGCDGVAYPEIADLCDNTGVLIRDSAGLAFAYRIWSNREHNCVSTPGVVNDVDGDGRSDLTLTGSTGYSGIPTAFSNGDGTYVGSIGPVSGDTNFAIYASQNGARPIAGDFNGDGVADVALIAGVNWNTVPVAYGLAGRSGGFYATNLRDDGSLSTYSQEFPFARSVAGDFDGDGRTDIALLGFTAWILVDSEPSSQLGVFQGSSWQISRTSDDPNFLLYAEQGTRGRRRSPGTSTATGSTTSRSSGALIRAGTPFRSHSQMGTEPFGQRTTG